MAFEKVKRQQAKLRLALTGVSGSGKTLGALYIAYGITGDWDKIAVIDTEHERARFYANREDLDTGEFLYSPMYAPFSPDRYKLMVAEGAKLVGPDGVVIVDSFSHAWNNEGGVLDIKDNISKRSGQNSYTAWGEAGKHQNSLVNSILSVPCHTIVTMRSKMEYVLETNNKGKQVPRKLGLAPVQREDTEYEFDIVLDIDRNHIATASKDTTFLDAYGECITPELGNRLQKWLSEGDAVDADIMRNITKEQAKAMIKAANEDGVILRTVLEMYGYTRTSQVLNMHYTQIMDGIQEAVKAMQAKPVQQPIVLVDEVKQANG